MGGKSSPPAPDYKGAAQEQAAASQQQTTQQTWANRPTINTPWGSQTWSASQGRDPSTGQAVTNWSTNINLTPEQQQALDSQQRIQQGRSNAAEQLLGQATSSFQSPMNWNSLPQGAQAVQAGQFNTQAPQAGNIQSQLQDPNAVRQQAQDAVYKLQQPYIQQQRGALESQLANQGITPGSEAYNNAMRQQGDAETRAQLQAIQAGQSEANQLFNQNLQSGQFANQAQAQQYAQGLQGANFQNSALAQQLQNQISAGSFNNQNRQQGISEMQMQRSQPLNELNALLTGQQVSSPNMPSFSQAGKAETPQLLNAANMGYQASLDAYNANQGALGGLTSGLFGLGSSFLGSSAGSNAVAGLFGLSDRRLKKNIRKVGEHQGINLYEYEFVWGGPRIMGVMAQEVPHAAVQHESGYLMVDYSKVWK